MTLSHKEWSIRQEEYWGSVQDYFENYSERGVAEKTDIAVSSKSETEHHQDAEHEPAARPGKRDARRSCRHAGSGAATSRRKSSRRSRAAATRKRSPRRLPPWRSGIRSSRSRSPRSPDHRTSPPRLYENTHEDKVMIVDYFRRMRKWRNQLFRTGIRLTYDVVLPYPGRRLRERWSALSAIDAQLGTAFESPLGSGYVPAGSATLLTPSLSGLGATDPSVGCGVQRAQRYREHVGHRHRAHGPRLFRHLAADARFAEVGREDQGDHGGCRCPTRAQSASELTLPIPEDYRPTTIWIGGRLAPEARTSTSSATTGPRQAVVSAGQPDDAQGVHGRGAGVEVAVATRRVHRVRRALGEAPRKGGHRSDAGRLAKVGDRSRTRRSGRAPSRAGTRSGSGSPAAAGGPAGRALGADTLSLRRMEREQVMHLVLEWLFPGVRAERRGLSGPGRRTSRLRGRTCSSMGSTSSSCTRRSTGTTSSCC